MWGIDKGFKTGLIIDPCFFFSITNQDTLSMMNYLNQLTDYLN